MIRWEYYAANFLGFRCHVIEPADVRILAYLNISFAGIFGFSTSVMVGECGDLRLCNAREAVACGRAHEDLIVGVKVRDRETGAELHVRGASVDARVVELVRR